MAGENFDAKALRDWWRDPDGKPFRDELRNLFAAAMSDMRKALRAEKHSQAYGHEVEATVYEDIMQLADGLIQDQVAKEKDEERKIK